MRQKQRCLGGEHSCRGSCANCFFIRKDNYKMATIKITDQISSVGVLNPNMRIFDIIMETAYGTSYNAYLVRGSEKTALIETVHHDYFDELLENLAAAGANSLDYIVLNHTEPDHSGALALLTERYPDAEIVCSQAAGIYLKNIANRPLKLRVVKDGEQLSLGDQTLQFLNAPFLHWPDSMFTFCPEQNLLFTCDFLGAHYCEPRMRSDLVSYPKAYEEAFRNYFNAIFGPFREYVLKGLEKIDGLTLAFVCPSHGPVLVGGDIENARQLYRSWSLPDIHEDPIVGIFYASAYGCTKALAEQIRDGIASVLPHAEVSLYNVNEHSMAELAEKMAETDAFLLGSPTLNKDAVAPIWDLLARTDSISARKKPAAAFGSFGWSGEAVPALTGRLREMKFKVFSDGFRACFVPSEEEKKAAFRFGAEFAESL